MDKVGRMSFTLLVSNPCNKTARIKKWKTLTLVFLWYKIHNYFTFLGRALNSVGHRVSFWAQVNLLRRIVSYRIVAHIPFTKTKLVCAWERKHCVPDSYVCRLCIDTIPFWVSTRKFILRRRLMSRCEDTSSLMSLGLHSECFTAKFDVFTTHRLRHFNACDSNVELNVRCLTTSLRASVVGVSAPKVSSTVCASTTEMQSIKYN